MDPPKNQPSHPTHTDKSISNYTTHLNNLSARIKSFRKEDEPTIEGEESAKSLGSAKSDVLVHDKDVD